MAHIKIEEDLEELYSCKGKTKRINKTRNNEQKGKSKMLQRVSKKAAKEQIFFESDDSNLSIVDVNGSRKNEI